MTTLSNPGDPYMWPNKLIAGNGLAITGSGGGTYTSVELQLDQSKEFKSLVERVGGIEDRLAILRPNWELQARFPALQEAYEHYKLIEKLVNDQTNK